MADSTLDEPERTPIAAGDFVLVAGNGQLLTHVIASAEIVIGRDPTCDLVLDHPTLSRRHAVLRLGPPVTVQDLGSTNGVRVARRTLRGGAPFGLEPGETFRIGGFSFNVVAASARAPSWTDRAGGERLRVDDPTVDGVSTLVRNIARSDASVLVLGESGVGKEILAETLHVLSGRTGELGRINCAALPEALVESELFGHERGAFTGAGAAKVGLLESVPGGTVFLDEIGELPPSTQAKLLRVLEAREVLRVGAVRPTPIDVRFIAATHRDLAAEVAARRFRGDLYFRLDGVSLHIPPLRERRERIAALAVRFANAAARKRGRSAPPLSAAVLAALSAHDWPGNVRELKAVIERGLLIAGDRELAVRDLVFSPRAPEVEQEPPGRTAEEPALTRLPPALLEQRRQLVAALERAGGNQTHAARALGISRTTLVNRMVRFQIPRPRG